MKTKKRKKPNNRFFRDFFTFSVSESGNLHQQWCATHRKQQSRHRVRLLMPQEPNSQGSGNEWMAVIVSLAVLGTALFVIVRESSDGTSRLWATGVVGTVVGYWLRGSRKAM